MKVRLKGLFGLSIGDDVDVENRHVQIAAAEADEFLKGLSKARRDRVHEEITALANEWNRVCDDTRRYFSLKEPATGRALAKEAGSKSTARKAGKVSAKRRGAKSAEEKAKVQRFADDEVRKLHAIGERPSREDVLQLVRKTMDTPLKDSTIIGMVRVKPKRP